MNNFEGEESEHPTYQSHEDLQAEKLPEDRIEIETVRDQRWTNNYNSTSNLVMR
jgi:hypothetical protein